MRVQWVDVVEHHHQLRGDLVGLLRILVRGDDRVAVRADVPVPVQGVKQQVFHAHFHPGRIPCTGTIAMVPHPTAINKIQEHTRHTLQPEVWLEILHPQIGERGAGWKYT